MQKIKYHVYLKRKKLWLNPDMYAQKEVCIDQNNELIFFLTLLYSYYYHFIYYHYIYVHLIFILYYSSYYIILISFNFLNMFSSR